MDVRPQGQGVGCRRNSSLARSSSTGRKAAELDTLKSTAAQQQRELAELYGPIELLPARTTLDSRLAKTRRCPYTATHAGGMSEPFTDDAVHLGTRPDTPVRSGCLQVAVPD